MAEKHMKRYLNTHFLLPTSKLYKPFFYFAAYTADEFVTLADNDICCE